MAGEARRASTIACTSASSGDLQTPAGNKTVYSMGVASVAELEAFAPVRQAPCSASHKLAMESCSLTGLLHRIEVREGQWHAQAKPQGQTAAQAPGGPDRHPLGPLAAGAAAASATNLSQKGPLNIYEGDNMQAHTGISVLSSCVGIWQDSHQEAMSLYMLIPGKAHNRVALHQITVKV